MMVGITGDRKRAALWTIGRGSRGLLRFSSNGESYVVAGTTAAKGGNRVHVLRSEEDEKVFKPVRVYEVEAEVWSVELVAVNENSVIVVALTRGKESTNAEVWSLSLEESQDTHSAYALPESSVDEALACIDIKCSLDLEGNGIKIKRFGDDELLYLAITDSSASILKISESFDAFVSISWTGDVLSSNSEEDRIVDGGWITDRHVFVVSHSAVAIYDSNTGGMEVLLRPSDVMRKAAADPDELWVPPFVSRITSVCYGRDNVLYVGGQDGSLRAFDLRISADVSGLPESDKHQWISIDSTGPSNEDNQWLSQLRWEAVKGHSQWVSVLCPMANGGVLSGDIDGVVRCWAGDGSPSGTFPQHVDTVTNATASQRSFVTISYDGRIALNQILVRE